MDNKIACDSITVYPDRQQAWECVHQQEREMKIPMSVMKVEWSGDPHIDGQYMVYEIFGCQENALYDHYVGPNEDWAKECAASLTRITGWLHIPQLIRRRFLFANVWSVF